MFNDPNLVNPADLRTAASEAEPSFRSAATQRLPNLDAVVGGIVADAESGASDSARSALVRVGIVGGGALLLLLLVTAFTAAVARSVSVPLRRLRSAAVETANVRLPAAVQQIERRGPRGARRPAAGAAARRGRGPGDGRGRAAPSTASRAKPSGSLRLRSACGARWTTPSSACPAAASRWSRSSSPSSTSSSARRRTRTSCATCSGSTTSPHGCGGTTTTCSCSRGPWSAPVAMRRCRSRTSSGPPRPRWSSTNGSACSPSAAPPSPARPPAASSTCSQSCSTTRPCTHHRPARS